MTEYIERETALNKAREILRGEECDCEFIPVIFEVLQGLPTADVAPVVHARWIEVGFEAQDVFGRLPPVKVVRGYRCSVCNKFERGKEPYCHCGAKMDLRGEDNNGSEKA